MRSCLGKISG